MIGKSRSIGGHIPRLIPPDSLLWYNDFVYIILFQNVQGNQTECPFSASKFSSDSKATVTINALLMSLVASDIYLIRHLIRVLITNNSFLLPFFVYRVLLFRQFRHELFISMVDLCETFCIGL